MRRRLDEGRGDGPGESYIAAIDQGTTSHAVHPVRPRGRVVARRPARARADLPQARLGRARRRRDLARTPEAVVGGALEAPARTRPTSPRSGITNQRETTVVWDRETGEPVHNAIVWQDTRTAAIVRRLGGSAAAPAGTASGPGCRWRRTSRARRCAGSSTTSTACATRRERRAVFGTIDTLGAVEPHRRPDGGVHVTDVTNASRTMLMDLTTLEWDAGDRRRDRHPAVDAAARSARPREVYGEVAAGPLAGVPIAGILGDQQAATFGQACLDAGEAKNTYGTGNFMLLNTGTEMVLSDNGLLTTVCYRIGDEDAGVRARGLDRGHRRRWCSGCATTSGSSPPPSEIEELARTRRRQRRRLLRPGVLRPVRAALAPRRPRRDRRADPVTSTRAHLARAALEATAFQTREVARGDERRLRRRVDRR